MWLKEILQEVLKVERKNIRWIFESIDSNKKQQNGKHVDKYKIFSHFNNLFKNNWLFRKK